MTTWSNVFLFNTHYIRHGSGLGHDACLDDADAGGDKAWFGFDLVYDVAEHELGLEFHYEFECVQVLALWN